MTRRPPLFKQRDVARAAKGARLGGLNVSKVEISPTGSIILHTGAVEEGSESALDKELSEHMAARGYGGP